MFLFLIFYKTALQIAIQKENMDIIKLLISNELLDINFAIISLLIFFK